MKKLIVIVIILMGISSCSSDSSTTPDYKNEIVTSVTDQIIIPRIQELLEKSNDLKMAVANFSNDQNESNLVNTREKLNSITELYAKMYVFNIGEAKNNFMNRKINFWPVYNISIEKNIEEGNFDATSLLNLGSAAKNLPGLNYLLFKEKNVQTCLQEFLDNSERTRYLSLITNEFHDNIKQLNSIWKATGSDYANTFKNNKEEGLLSSFNLLFNGLNNVVDNCKVTKIGKPSGLERSEHTNPEIVENFYAENSLVLVKNNILSVEELFFAENITSIGSYINSITKNTELTESIKAKINNIKNTIDNIQGPLKDAVDNDRENIKQLHTSLKELLVILHTDVRSVLSIIITGTDNDGD